jgi:formylglycine-generating enzyme required for sulfatase activity
MRWGATRRRRTRFPSLAVLGLCSLAGLQAREGRAEEPALRAGVKAVLEGWASPDGAAIDSESGFPKRILRSRDAMAMRLVPRGTFQMGAVPGDEAASDLEKPRHAVTLTKAYYLDEHEVTNAQFAKFTEASGRVEPEAGDDLVFGVDKAGDYRVVAGVSWRKPLPGGSRPDEWERHPVVFVTWEEASAYAAWAGGRRGGVKLPTEAQFERALRAGTEGRVYPWGDDARPPPRFANYGDETANRQFRLRAQGRWCGPCVGYDDGVLRTAPVKSFRANEYGLFDVSGNVWEWCLDHGRTGFGEGGALVDPTGPATGNAHVVRGSSFRANEWGHDCGAPRCSNRVSLPSQRTEVVGFRCARTLP